MSKEAFVQKAFRRSSLTIIDQANTIIAEYQGAGFTLTLRQLYYQFVARDIIPNRQSEYKRLGSIINDARLAGLIDWNAIEDRTRNVRSHNSWSSPESIVSACARQYAEDLWDSQDFRMEVWIEKDALIGVVEPICTEWRLPYYACRGYSSQSEQYAAGKRFASLNELGITPIVLHLGDHDPSGIDMTRDNADRLAMFARHGVEVRRLALNMNQIEEYGPPPNPAKETDSRFANYSAEYNTDESWELDALEPQVISELIRTEIDRDIDLEAWNAAYDASEQNRETLSAIADRWDAVQAFLAEDRP